MVVRNGRVLARSQEQQHYFNTPFQLTLVPPSYRGRVLSDRYVYHQHALRISIHSESECSDYF